MLQLLLERGQTYGDLASVLGVDEPEVRSRARAALTELAGVDPDRHVGLTDYLLGQADPIGRADAVRHLKDDPEDLALATELAQKLRLVAPQAELPRLPGEERRPRARRRTRLPMSRLPVPERLRGRRTAEGETGATAVRTALTKRQTQLMVGFASGGVLLIVIILAATGAFGGSGDNGTTSTTTTAPPIQNLASVRLKPQTSENASGTANFGLANGQTPFVDVRLEGLKPAPGTQTYVIWLLLTQNQGYPLSPIQSCGPGVPQPCLSANGSFVNRFAIPSPILPVVTRVQLVDISIAPAQTVRKAIQTAISQKKIVIRRPGTSILRGAIPSSRGGKR
jgi:hypothetical protein